MADTENKKWGRAKKALAPIKMDFTDMKKAPSRCSQFFKKLQVAFDGEGIADVSDAIVAVKDATLTQKYDPTNEYLKNDLDKKLYSALYPLLDDKMMNLLDRYDLDEHYGTHIVHLMVEEFIHVSPQKQDELEEELRHVGTGSFAKECTRLSGAIANLKAIGVPISETREKASFVHLVKNCLQTSSLGRTVALWAIDSSAKELRSAIEDWVSAESNEDEPVLGESRTGGTAYGANNNTECYHCGEHGHIARWCPMKKKKNPKKKGGGPRQVPGTAGYTGCNICKSKQHRARDCPKADDEFAGIAYGVVEDDGFDEIKGDLFGNCEN